MQQTISPGRLEPIQAKSHYKLKDRMGSFLFVVPFLLAFIAFLLVPIVYGFVISLFQWNSLDSHPQFIGLKNYTE